MSIKSRAKQEKKPSPTTSKRPRLRGKRPEPLKPFNLTDFQREAHVAAVQNGDGGIKKHQGAFGTPRWSRKPRPVKEVTS